MLLVDIALWLMIFLVAGMAMTMVFHCITMVPYVPTPHAVSRKMIEFAGVKNGQTVYDLGAGDARVLIAAKTAFPDIIAKGSEISPIIYLLGLLNIRRSGLKIAFSCTSFFRADLRDADCIFLYLMPEALRKLEAKFDAELKPGTRVLSYTFHFEDRTPVATCEVPWITGKRKLWLYEWPAR